MTQVYMVTSGTYSDYRVNGVFSTEEKARAYMEKMETYAARIEIRTLDEDDLIHAYTEVVMNRNGDVWRTGTEHWAYTLPVGKPHFIDGFVDDISLLVNTVETDSVERAVKVTNELRSRILAESLWPDAYDRDVVSELIQELVA